MNTKSFHDSVILVTKLTQTQHEISCVLLNFFRLLSPGPCFRSVIKKFHNFLVGVDMNFVKQFDLLKKSVSKGGKTENNHKKTKFQFLFMNYELSRQGREGSWVRVAGPGQPRERDQVHRVWPRLRVAGGGGGLQQVLHAHQGLRLLVSMMSVPQLRFERLSWVLTETNVGCAELYKAE